MTRRFPNEPRWPAPANEAAAGELLRQVLASASRSGSVPSIGPEGQEAIRAIGGNSPFLADLARREWPSVLRLVAEGPDAVVADAIASVAATDWAAPRHAVRAALRRDKRIASLAIAWADIGGFWTVEQVTGALSALAERALRCAVDHLLHEEAEHGRLALRDRRNPSRGSGFTVIGMGKLGAGELNYSSDVDLVLLFDGDRASVGSRAAEPGSVFARVARDLVSLMAARDADGYVFRVDLRLRPDPASTPPALSVAGAVTYYESMAQTWERAAFSKGRPVAGDLEAGAAFLDSIGPFLWRRHLDFAVLDDMQAMKRRIDEHAVRRAGQAAGGGDPADVSPLFGRDLKRGPGGIREIEFIAQTLQLVWGGRHPEHRLRGTVEALRLLAARGRLDRDEAARLEASYDALRRLEHRLQMVADRQTHALPTEADSFARFALFMGFRDAAALSLHVRSIVEPVEAAFRAVLSEADGTPPVRVETAARADAFRNGLPRALRSDRALRLHDRILPVLLARLERAADPAAALRRWEGLIERLPEGITLLSLLARNPALVVRIADLLSAAPPLADTLSQSPGAIEGLLAPDEIDRSPSATLRRLVRSRRDPESLETAIETCRAHARAEAFRLSVLELENRIDVDEAGRARTALAEAVVALLLDRVERLHAGRWGRAPGGGIAVVALGKAGSRRMMAGSDLDLLLVYDAPEAAAPDAPPYYGRLAHALIGALTAPGRDGPLYRCDMRLRPSGRAGPVAVSLPSFVRYHQERSWTWERMALARARPIAGPPPLRRRVAAGIGASLDRAVAPETVRADAVDMRARLLRDRKPEGPFDVRLRPGGLMEVEFIAQALLLGPRPGLRRRTGTADAFRALRRAGLIGAADASALIEADRFWRTLQSRLRLLHGLSVPTPPLAPSVRDGLLPALGQADIEAAADAVASGVRVRFERLLGRLPD